MAETAPKPYRANRKKFFLTYAQCGQLTPAEVLAHLETCGEVSKYLIATEKHQDGGNHIHAYVEFAKKQDFKNCRWADVNNYHPNDKGNPKSDYAVARYCSKDGNFITNYWEEDPFAQALNAATVKDGIEILKKKRPRETLLHGEAIERNLKRLKAEKRARKYKPEDFNVPLQSTELAVLIHGPTNCGKTQYALAHFENPLLVRHIDRLKNFSPDNDGIVFDDVCFNHWPTNSVIQLLDMEEDSDIHTRYTIASIPAGTKRIFTYNNDNPFYGPTAMQEHIDAIERRLKKFSVDKKLFL